MRLLKMAHYQSIFRKILKKTINKRLINYLDKFNTLLDPQFVFRQARTTEDTLFTFAT